MKIVISESSLLTPDIRVLSPPDRLRIHLDMRPPTASLARTALPAAHFERNDVMIICGTLGDGNQQSLVCDGRKPVESIHKSCVKRACLAKVPKYLCIVPRLFPGCAHTPRRN